MTNLDSIIENAVLDVPVAAPPSLPKRPGLWRAVSLVGVTAALVIAAISILQSRDASNVAVPDREPVALETTTVTASDIDVPGGAQIAVLGLAESDSQRDFDPAGTYIDLPEGMAAVVAMSTADDELIGLAVARASQDRTSVEISARSTARALLVLAPGILRPNLGDSFANIEVIETDPAFTALVDALAANPSLSSDNEQVEQAFAEIADRLPAVRPPAEQGCDSVIARDAYPTAGTCAQPEATGVLVANEQDRWALVFDGANDYTNACAAISPNGVTGDEVLIPDEQCTGQALLVAPGPIPNQGDDQAVIEDRVRAAAAVMYLYAYAGPFADLAGASAGFTQETTSHIRRNTGEVVDAVRFLIETHEDFAAAMDANRVSTTPLDRHTAAVAATRRLIAAADTTALIPQRVPGNDTYVDLLDFYVRVGERMVSPRTDWRWEADAVGTIDFGGDGT